MAGTGCSGGGAWFGGDHSCLVAVHRFRDLQHEQIDALNTNLNARIDALGGNFSPPLSRCTSSSCLGNGNPMTPDHHHPRRRWCGPQRRIGISGGIATGRITTAAMLSNRHGLPVLEAEVVSGNYRPLLLSFRRLTGLLLVLAGTPPMATAVIDSKR